MREIGVEEAKKRLVEIALSSVFWAIPFFAVAGSYALAAVGLSILTVWDKKKSLALVLSFLFFLLHCAYGIGTLVGIFSFGAVRRVKAAEKNVALKKGE